MSVNGRPVDQSRPALRIVPAAAQFLDPEAAAALRDWQQRRSVVARAHPETDAIVAGWSARARHDARNARLRRIAAFAAGVLIVLVLAAELFVLGALYAQAWPR